MINHKRFGFSKENTFRNYKKKKKLEKIEILQKA